ncbi:MAG: hypothetical protein AABX02_01430 [archaeon]
MAIPRMTKIFLLSLTGFLFAGFLTYSKLTTGTCPLTEGCPYLLGLPVCVYGLVLFGIILAMSILHDTQRNNMSLSWIRWVSLFGVAFSGYYAVNELLFPSCFIGPCTYTLLLPSCVYGLAMYALIAFWAWKKEMKMTE